MIIFKLSTDDVRNICIANEQYTCGTVSEYNEMLDDVREYCDNIENKMFELNVDLRIENIAQNILAHSDDVKLCKQHDCTYYELGMNMIHTLLNKCWLTVENQVAM